MIERVEAKGGYVNFYVRFEDLAQPALEDAVARKESFGKGESKGVRMLLEHTSANPTGPLHVGRARNPIIGDTIARVLRMAGYDVVTEFYVNDVGRQKPGTMVPLDASIRIRGNPIPYVSRGGLKLVHALDEPKKIPVLLYYQGMLME